MIEAAEVKETKTTEPKFLKVYSQDVAGMMMLYGCKLIRLEPNEKNPEYNVFVFNNTEDAKFIFSHVVSKKKAYAKIVND